MPPASDGWSILRRTHVPSSSSALLLPPVQPVRDWRLAGRKLCTCNLLPEPFCAGRFFGTFYSCTLAFSTRREFLKALRNLKRLEDNSRTTCSLLRRDSCLLRSHPLVAINITNKLPYSAMRMCSCPSRGEEGGWYRYQRAIVCVRPLLSFAWCGMKYLLKIWRNENIFVPARLKDDFMLRSTFHGV
jgi:hypothetical protein